MKQYKLEVPPTMICGSYKSIVTVCDGETKASAALDDYNHMLAYSGYPPLNRMPNGTKYTLIK